ncbi:MAG: hypothetical protein GDA53_10290 [Rhodobacteraceae bacterium]|nr:hypothetical protein [Paracoccaceae bacterium]
MTKYIEELIESLDFEVVSEITTPHRAERRRGLPDSVLTNDMRPILEKVLKDDDLKVWEHQA